MDVRGRHRQRHGAGETLLSVAPHPVEATVLQVADGRPAGGVGAPRPAERLPAFPDAVRLRQPAPAGHRVGSSIPAGSSRSGGGAVRTPVEAHHRQVGEPRPRLPAHGDRHVHVAPLPHDGTVREESVTVLRDADGDAGLHRDPGLSLRYPARVRCGIVPPFRIRRPVRSARCLTWPMKPRILSDGPGIPNLPSISARLASALSASFSASRSGTSTSPGRGLASRDVATRSFPQRYSFRRQPGGPRPPAGPGHVPDHAPRRVHRQAAVGRMMDVGPGHEGITAAARRGARLFRRHPVAPLHDHPSDPGGKLRRGERHAVNQTLVSVSVPVP